MEVNHGRSNGHGGGKEDDRQNLHPAVSVGGDII